MERRTENLTLAERHELVRLLATHTSEEAIQEWLTLIGKPSKDIGQYLNHYRRNEKYRPLMEKIRAQYEAGIADISVASKRYRLHQYQIMFNQLKADGKFELAAKMLERCQGEIESKRVDSQTNIFITQFNQLTERELEERRLQIVEKISRLKNQQKLQLERGGYDALRAEEAQQTEEVTEVIDAEIVEENEPSS